MKRHLFALLGLAFLAVRALATTFLPMPFSDRVGESRTIVRATAGPSHSDWAVGMDGSRRIYTFTEMRIREVIKESTGQPAPRSEFTVREMGGAKDGVGLQIAGTARFKEGEDVVLMLGAENSDGSLNLNGMVMGRYDVVSGTDGSEVLSGPGLEEGQPFEAKAGGKWTLDRLRQEVRRQADRGPPSQQPQSESAVTATGPEGSAGASALHPESAAPGPEGSPEESGGRGGRAWLWGLGIVAALGVIVLWSMGLARSKQR